MPITGSWADQLAAVQQRQTYDARLSSAARNPNTNATVAAGVVAQGQAYPWMTPQTAYALAANGNQPGDALSQAVATAALNKKGGGFWHAFGHVVTAPVRAVASSATRAATDVAGALKPLSRDVFTAAETPLQVAYGALRDVAAVGGDVVGGIAAGAATGAAGAGIAGGTLGTIVPGLGNLVGAIGGAAGGAVVGGIAGGVAGAAAQAKGVEVKGKVVNPLEQSTGGLALEQLVAGKKVDLGSGFLPGGAIRAAQVKNAQDAASIDGHALTPGRMLASGLFRPGTTPYNLMSGVADAIDTFKLDPTIYALKDVGAAREAAGVIPGAAEVKTAGPLSRALSARAGLLDASDPAVNLDKARRFLTSDGAAQRFVDKVAATDSASEIRAASKGKIPAQVANQLAAATDRQDIVDVLLNGVTGGDLKEKAAVRAGRSLTSTLQTFRPAARLAGAMDRLGSVLPEHSVDLLDVDKPGGAFKLDSAVDQAENWMKQVRIPAGQRGPILDRLMRTTTAAEAKDVLTGMVDDTFRQRLLDLGNDPADVNRLLGTARGDTGLVMSQAHTEVANDVAQKAVRVGDQLLPLDPPDQVAEQAAAHFQFPQPKAMRELSRMSTGNPALRALYTSRPWQESVNAAEWGMQKWKVGAVARLAFIPRTLGMETAKAAAHGLETSLSDPGSLVRMAFDASQRPQYWEGLTEGTPLSQAETWLKVAASRASHLTPDDLAPFQQVLRPGDEGFAKAWSARVAELHADPLARSVAQQGYAATADSFWGGDLAAERQRIAVEAKKPELLNSRRAADSWINDTVGSHLQALTADNPDLMRAVGTGKVLGIDLLASHPDGFVNPEVEKAFAGLVRDPAIEVPGAVPGAKPVTAIDPDYGHKVSRMTQWLYGTVGKGTDFLTRMPAYNELFWRNVADHAAMLDTDGTEALRARLASDSPLVRIPDAERARLEAAVAKPTAGAGRIGIDHLDDLAHHRAMDGIRDMTIQLSRKTGWQDSARLISPFAKHWQQEISQWVRIATDHPDAFRKADMIVQGAQGSGFFRKDDTGQWVFTYPGSNLVSKVLTGTPFPVTGKAAGLASITTDMLPSFGPLVSIPAAKILPNKPEYDDVRNFIAPYGDPTAQGVVNAVLPSWAKTVRDALADPKQDSETGNVTMQVARYLVSTGKYSTDTPEAQAELLKEAGSRAKKLLTLQAIGKFVLPSSPKLQPMAEDKDGRTVVAKLLSNDLNKMRDANYDTATENFLDKYGDGAMLFLQSATRPVIPGAASTKEQEDFVRSNPDVAENYPDIAAFFAPQGGQTPDYNAVTRQLHAGQRQQLTPAQQVALANDQVGNMIFYTAKAKLGPRPSTAQQAWLANVKTALMAAYPGFNAIVSGLAARPVDDPNNVSDVLVPEMRRAVADPKLADSDTGKALSTYLAARDKVDATAQARGLKAGSFSQAASASDLRAWLRALATVLGQDNAGFQLLFDRVLDRELRTDTEPTPAPASA